MTTGHSLECHLAVLAAIRQHDDRKEVALINKDAKRKLELPEQTSFERSCSLVDGQHIFAGRRAGSQPISIVVC